MTTQTIQSPVGRDYHFTGFVNALGELVYVHPEAASHWVRTGGGDADVHAEHDKAMELHKASAYELVRVRLVPTTHDSNQTYVREGMMLRTRARGRKYTVRINGQHGLYHVARFDCPDDI